MADETFNKSLDFLTDAAHLLSTTSPAISANLMVQRRKLILENGMEQSDTQRQHVCGSCGHIMVPGLASLVKLESSRPASKRCRERDASSPQSNIQSMQGARKTLTCGLCGQYTRIKIPPAPPIVRHAKRLRSRRGTRQASLSSNPNTQVTEMPPKLSANASSKKRAKSRRHGLQALLQQSQSANPRAGFGLSLTDFMKK